MQNNRFLEGLRRVYARYDRLMEKQGFYIVLGVCVLVILLSAPLHLSAAATSGRSRPPRRIRARRRWRRAARRERRP